jgi:transposase
LCQCSKEVTVTHGLVIDFQDLVRCRKAEQLATWVSLALASGIEEMASFARGVQRDFAAVYAGMELDWSQGPVEGHVNRLKMIKRTMFGRANFDLLRLRVLYSH